MEKRTESDSHKLIRIAITGPESTGKSMLTKELAFHYHDMYVSEYARQYIETIHRPYNYNDILVIAKRQISTEIKCLRKASEYLFCDTELTVLKIWAEHKYKKCHPWIIKKLEAINYDLYLLCDIDLPWQPDPLREHPRHREFFFKKYLDELASRNLPYVIISGTGKKRIKNAIDAVEELRHK